MKFAVTRTTFSGYEKEPPCEEAQEFPLGAPGDDDEFVEHMWWIEIDSLEELLAFCHKYGGAIILHSHNSWVVEIYDGYRE